VVEKPRFRDYTIRKGDTSFEAIAARPEVYGDRRLASALRDANPFVSPDRLMVGRTVIRVPIDPANVSGRVVTLPPPRSPDVVVKPPALPDRAPPAVKPPAAPVVPAAGPVVPAAAPTTVYVVAGGDTLSGIAKKHYGKSALWTIILDANQDVLDDPAKLKAGMKLRIPPAPKD
jgi:LysM repeat protein